MPATGAASQSGERTSGTVFWNAAKTSDEQQINANIETEAVFNIVFIVFLGSLT